MRGDLLLPFLVIDTEKFDDAFVLNVKVFKIEIVGAGQPADGRFDCAAGAFAAIDHPFEHAHVLAEPWPEKLSVRTFAEPVHVKDERRVGEALTDLDPMPKIIADVIAPKRQHRHSITSHPADRSGSCSGWFGGHGCSEVNTVLP